MVDGLHYLEDDGYGVVSLTDPVELHVDDWGSALQAALTAPLDLGGAPFASWVLARLFALSTDLGSVTGSRVEVVDDAVFVLDWVVSAEDEPVAKVQIQGGMLGVGLLGVQARDLGRRIVDPLTAVLAARPHEVATGVIRVRDPDWVEAPHDYRPRPGDDAANVFGWDGVRYLGADNVVLR